VAPSEAAVRPGPSGYCRDQERFEQNYSRFGGFLAEAIGGSEADLDKDGQTSLLEAL